MRKLFSLVVLSMFVFVACDKGSNNATATGGYSSSSTEATTSSETDTGQVQMATDFTADEIDAETLWVFLTETKDYTDWEFMPGKEGMYEGQSPHGAYLKTYVNNVLKQALPLEEGGSLPVGSVIMKENYSPEKELAALTAMIKVDGFNPDAGNWYWVKYTSEGEVQKSGAVDGCINCHTAKSDNDYVMVQDLSEI